LRRNALPALFAALVIVHGSAEAADYSGRARVIDGDTISIRNQRIRIAAIDACERDQTGSKGGKLWPCGVAARSYLGKMIDGQHVRCDIIDQDQYRRLVGQCFIGDVDIGLALVKGEGRTGGGNATVSAGDPRDQRGRVRPGREPRRR